MPDLPVSISRTAPGETVLDPEPAEALTALAAALALPEADRCAEFARQLDPALDPTFPLPSTP